LYAEHGGIRQSRRYANEKRPESSQLEELTQLQQYEPIDCFNHALRIYTKEYVPATYWAMLQHNLGLAYFNRNQGDRRENLERSIECFKKSLEIFTQNEFPDKWKINHEDLAICERSLALLPKPKGMNNFNECRNIIIPLQALCSGLSKVINRLFEIDKKSLTEDIFNRPISYRKLKCADLSDADLSNTFLRKANLRKANLRDVNLSNAELSYAKLRNANLRCANLRNANMCYAKLSNADLSYADLNYTNLSDSELTYTDLSYSNLSDANLRGANLSNANLNGANVSNTRFGYKSGFSESVMQDLIERGAIFDEPPRVQSESRNLVPR
jgi:uncharacterized protein YjbI with pentapeptide repeats